MDEPTVTTHHDGASVSSGPAQQAWGDFVLQEKVGQGGFGEVYRAWDPKLEREVALKLLLNRGAGHDAEYDALLREARLMARVRHPNVVPVYGVDRHNDRVGFWSDFVRGSTLSSLLNAQGPFGAREAALIGIEVCKALSAVHGAGLLHKDIKAGNVMREEGGRILLMDFGLSQELNVGAVVGGTPVYMAPELFKGERATVASDIYAVGILLFYLVTGKHPVETQKVSDFPRAHESVSRRSLIDYRPDLPEGFAHAVDTAIDPNPAKRFATAGQMLGALAETLGTTATLDSIQKPGRTFRRVWIWAAAAGLAIAAAVYLKTPVQRIMATQGAGTTRSAYDRYIKADELLLRYDKADNVQKAVTLLNESTREDARFALAYAALGRAHYLEYRGKRDPALLEEAGAACNRALALDSQLAPVHVTLALLHNLNGRTALATHDVEEALRLDARSAEVYAAQAEVLKAAGRNADAEAAIQKAIDLAPSDWRWPNQLGYYYLETGKLQEAAAQYRKVISLTPDNTFGWSNLAAIYYKQERFSDARAAIEKSVQIQPRYASLSTLGLLLVLEGRYQEAAQASERAIQFNPSNYITWGNLAAAYEMSPGGREKSQAAYRKAITLAEKSRTESPKDARLLANLGVYYAAVGEAVQSLPLLREAMALSPENPDVIYRAGEGCELLGRRDEALRWIAKALELGYSSEMVRRDPDLSALRADPRFSALRAKR